MTMTAKGLAKLIEECGELQQILGKKLAYFHTDEHPDGKGSMRERLQDEIADVMAACTFVSRTMELDPHAINARRIRKLGQFHDWHDLTDNNEHGVDGTPAEALK